MNKQLAVVLMFASMLTGCMETVEPGERGVLVDFGSIKEPLLGEGLHYEGFGVTINRVSIRAQKKELPAPCFSSDLQEVQIQVAVLYRIPEASIIRVFRDFHGEPFDVLVAPRVQESIKEATASRTAEQIVKQREAVKIEALEHVRKKVGDVVVIDDLVIVDIGLTKQLKEAIESKMVQEQEASKARFTKQLAETQAEIALVKAEGESKAILSRAKAEAEAIRIQGEALKQNTPTLQLELIKKWKGDVPHVVSGSSGTNILLPVDSFK